MSLDHSTARPATGDHDPFYDAVADALDELQERRQANEPGGAIHVPVTVPAGIDDEYIETDDRGTTYLIDGDGNEYDLDVESGGYRQPEADVLLTEDDDGLRLVAGNADVFSVRGEEDGDWPGWRVPEGMYEAAFEDMAANTDDETVHDRFYRLSDAVLADRFDPDAETYVVAVTGPNLSPLYDNSVIEEALERAGYGVETVGVDDEGVWTGDVWEVDDTDFYEMDDGTVMLRNWDGTFYSSLEDAHDDPDQLQHDPVWRYLNDHPEIDEDKELRVYPAWVPEPAGEDVEDAQVYRHTRTEITSLLSDINTPWRDIEARRPRNESMSMTTGIELNSGQEPFSEDPADWLFLNVMNGAGAAYPYFTIPNDGDVDRKLEIVEDVTEELMAMADEATTWQEASNYLPRRINVDMDTIHEENDFFEQAIQQGELAVEEVRHPDRNDHDDIADRARSEVMLRTDDAELSFTYGDGGLTSERVLDPGVRKDNTDLYRLLDWLEDQGVDVDYDRRHTEGYDDLLRDEAERQLTGAAERLEELDHEEFDLFGRYGFEEVRERYPDKTDLELVRQAQANQLQKALAAQRAADHLDAVQDGDLAADELRERYGELDELEDDMRYSPVGTHGHGSAVREVIDPVKRGVRRLHELAAGDIPDNPYTQEVDQDEPEPREEIQQARAFLDEAVKLDDDIDEAWERRLQA